MFNTTEIDQKAVYDSLGIIREPTLADLQTTHESVVSFAQNAIKSSFILNGGGFALIPSVLASVKLESLTTISIGRLIVAALFFSLGLCCAATTNLLAFLSTTRRHSYLLSALHHQTYRHYIDHGIGNESHQKLIEAIEIKSPKFDKSRLKWRKSAMCMCLASLIFFVFGVIISFHGVDDMTHFSRLLRP